MFPAVPEPDRKLDPAEVAVDAPHAIVDEGVVDQWPPLIDVRRLIPTIWRKLGDLRDRFQTVRDHVIAQGEEINAIETVLGINPQGVRQTVAARLTAIEARLTALENR